MIEKFKEYYKNTKQKIENRMEVYNQELERENNSLLKDNFKLFTNLNRDGKLVRGTLVNLGYTILKDDNDYSLDLSLAYEVFQTGILVHDDIIDNDDTRRGKDTIHHANIQKYQKYSNDQDEVKHFSDSIAICMGDYGLYEANRIISETYKDDPNLGRVLSNFNHTVLTTIRGELMDVILPFHGKNNLISKDNIEKDIMEIYRLKTAHYTIIGPLSVGILLAGGTEKMVQAIEKFGEKVGIAFQIQDDVLGIYSDNLGKVKGSDIKEFKQTILYSHILKTDYKTELLKLYGKDDLTEDNIQKVQDLFKKAGSYDYAIQTMNQLYDESLLLLESYDWISEDKKDLLRGFVNYLRERNK